MNIKKLLLLNISIIFLCIICFNALDKKPSSLCSGNMSIIKGGDILNMSTKFSLVDNDGWVALRGYSIDTNGNKEELDRTIYFESEYKSGVYHLKSTKIITSINETIETKTLSKWFPNFYLEKNNDINIRITWVNFNSVVVNGEYLPFYLCTKKN